MINTNRGKKGKFLPLFLCLILSCSTSNYKEEVKNKTEELLTQLQNGRVELLPGYDIYRENLDNEALEQLKNSFSSISSWSIEVTELRDGYVNVITDLIINDSNSSLIFQYKKVRGEWILQEEMNIRQSYSIVEGD